MSSYGHFNNLATQRALHYLALLVALCMFSQCASDQSGQQGEDPIDQGAGQENISNTSLNGPNSSDDVAQGASMNNAGNWEGNGDNFSGQNGGNNFSDQGFSNQGGSNNGFSNNGLNGNTPSNNFAMDEDIAQGGLLNNVPMESDAPLNANPGGLLNQSAQALNTTPLNNGVNAFGANPAASGQSANISETIPAEMTPQTISQAPSGNSISARAAASPFTNPHMNWPGKGRVKYVTRTLSRHSAPNGPILGEFEQGEHPLIFQNGNWVELHDGSFVRGNGLSEKPVGYRQSRKFWQ
jgi:hypothetical protein